jgi:hypothetical protein
MPFLRKVVNADFARLHSQVASSAWLKLAEIVPEMMRFVMVDCPDRRDFKGVGPNSEKSARAIAAEIGVGNATVSRERRKSVVPNDTPEKVVAKDGKSYPSKKSKHESSKRRNQLETIYHLRSDASADRCEWLVWSRASSRRASEGKLGALSG